MHGCTFVKQPERHITFVGFHIPVVGFALFKAKEIFVKFLQATVETGMPYVFYRDTVNKLNPNKHEGNIYSTQLCTEICQNTSRTRFVEEKIEEGKIVLSYEPGDLVVCNLASINVAKVNTKYFAILPFNRNRGRKRK